MILRNETSSDIEVISKVTIAAFKNLAISNHTEQFIINALRDANALTISLIAEVDEKVVGHIAFSPRAISDGSLNWYYSTKMPLRNKVGNIIGTFGISRDITERKRAEEEI